jgi:hypothetical protein
MGVQKSCEAVSGGLGKGARYPDPIQTRSDDVPRNRKSPLGGDPNSNLIRLFLFASLMSGLPANIFRTTLIGVPTVGTRNFTVALSHF